MNEPKQVIVIRTDTDPKMRKGKMIAQGAHSPMKMLCDLFGEINYDDKGNAVYTITIHQNKNPEVFKWMTEIFKKVVVGATLDELINVYQKAKLEGIPCSLIEDKGLTEFGGNVTITACAIGPDAPEKIDSITGHLKLL